MRMIQIQENMAEQKNIKDKLENEQEKLHVEYNKVRKAVNTTVLSIWELTVRILLFKGKTAI